MSGSDVDERALYEIIDPRHVDCGIKGYISGPDEKGGFYCMTVKNKLIFHLRRNQFAVVVEQFN